jgi:hypothetical protein
MFCVSHRSIGVALSFVLLCLLVACGAEPTPEQRASNCDADRDCPSSQVCRAGWCSLPEGAGTFDFRFLTPNSSIYVPQSVNDVRVDTESSMDFGLRPGVNARGDLVYTNSEESGPSGTVIFRPVGSESDFLERRAPIQDGRFQTYVLPGTYKLSFVPEDSTRAPGKVWPPQSIEKNWSGTLEIPRYEALAPVNGTVSFMSEAAQEYQNLSGARVFAVSTDDRFTSTTDTTDENGSYTLRVIPDSGTYNVHIQPSRPDAYLPKKEFPRAFTASGPDGEVSPQSLTNQLGQYYTDKVTFHPRLGVDSDTERDIDWSGTRLAVEGTLGDGMFTQTTTSDRNGSMEPITLLRGTYDVTIVPPADSPVAPKTDITLTVGPTTVVNRLYSLDLKPRFRGELVDSAGRPVPDTSLEFRPVNELEGILKLPVLTVETGDDGSFDVPLDDRNYRVIAKPPPNSGQPAHIYTLNGETLGRDQTYTWKLPAPMTVTGTVFGQSSDASVQSIERTTVEVTRTIGDDVVRVGRTQTESDGSFRLVLPAVEKPETETP